MNKPPPACLAACPLTSAAAADERGLASAMREMLNAVESDRCDGDSMYAHGVNAACRRHASGLRRIMASVGVAP